LVQQLHALNKVQTGVFEPQDLGRKLLGKPENHGIGKVDAGSYGHIVEEEGEGATFGQVAVMGVKALCGGLIVVGGYREKGLSGEMPRVEGHFLRDSVGVVAACADYDGEAVPHFGKKDF